MNKVTDAMLSLWAKILEAVPGSRLVVLVESGNDQTPPSVRSRFERQGLAKERVQFVGRQKRWQYLEMLAACDVCLDTFPYNGCTTTCDSLWMETPVVTLTGSAHVSRVGLSLLSQVGLASLVTESPVEYVKIATDLANHRAKLRVMRSGIRDRMRHSPLTDAKGVTQKIEAGLRAIWIEWCAARAGQT
jgi:predicted O-linked N-acetylglucosamine transferase (SPINDLY family)